MLLFTFISAFFFIGSSIAGYVLEDDYSASNFFDMFSFFTDTDPTHGFVNYVDQATAQSSGLASTSSNGVYMGVDYTNQAPDGRSSVRLTSNKSYNSGSLVILDLQHMPGGVCGTWPAFWTVGPSWPAGGEIDIIEGVHTQSTNDMTLHTSSGCSITNNNAFSGTIGTSNCDVNAFGQNTNAGCQIDTPNTATYGSQFNANGGGVYALEWTASAISIYFFQRGSIPSDISGGSPDPSSWGTPLAQFQGACNIPEFFKDNQLVFDTTFCGDWAGATWGTSGCSSEQYSTCEAFVAGNPSAFKDAYWQVNSLQVYQQGSSTSSSTPTSVVSQVAAPSVNVPSATVSAPSAATSASSSNDGQNTSGVQRTQQKNSEGSSSLNISDGSVVTINDDTPVLSAEVENGGSVHEANEATRTGISMRRRSTRHAQRDTDNSPQITQEWHDRLAKEKLRRMRHVRNVGSHGGVFRH